MDQVENKPMNATQTAGWKILDFLIGFLGSFIVANIALVLFAPSVDATRERLWITYFMWFWRFALAGLAVFFFTRKRIWIAIGLVAAILTQASNIYVGLAGLVIMLLIAKKFWISMPL